jgi:hypothetical protein
LPDVWSIVLWMLGTGLSWLMTFGALVAFLFVIGHVLVALVLIIPTWRICTRAGFSGALSLLHLVPVVGTLVVMAILAFSDWPAGEAPPQKG